ncbi:unnamed protein product [Rotaria sp. Silwood1]|nr:unnamed protein product [Rotaria sp. Silwood1]
MDTGGEDRQAKSLKTTRVLANSLINSLQANDSVALIEYNDDVKVLSDWTNNKTQLTEIVNKKLNFGKRSKFVDANLPCPKLSVIAPNDLIHYGKKFTFTAKIEGINSNNINYFWKINTGKIIDGQGTPVLEMTGDPGSTVIATVEIKGLSESCPKFASNAANLATWCPPNVIKLAEYNLLLPKIFKSQLDGMFIELNNNTSATGYIFDRFKSNTSASLIQQKVNQTLNYMQIRKIPIERIKLFVAIDDKSLTELWIKPAGADAPPFEDVTNPIEINPQNDKKELAKIFAAKPKKSQQKSNHKN